MLGIIAQMEGDTPKALELLPARRRSRPARGDRRQQPRLAVCGTRREARLRAAARANRRSGDAEGARGAGHARVGLLQAQGGRTGRRGVPPDAGVWPADNPTYHYHLGLAYLLAEDPGQARQSSSAPWRWAAGRPRGRPKPSARLARSRRPPSRHRAIGQYWQTFFRLNGDFCRRSAAAAR